MDRNNRHKSSKTRPGRKMFNLDEMFNLCTENRYGGKMFRKFTRLYLDAEYGMWMKAGSQIWQGWPKRFRTERM